MENAKVLCANFDDETGTVTLEVNGENGFYLIGASTDTTGDRSEGVELSMISFDVEPGSSEVIALGIDCERTSRVYEKEIRNEYCTILKFSRSYGGTFDKDANLDQLYMPKRGKVSAFAKGGAFKEFNLQLNTTHKVQIVSLHSDERKYEKRKLMLQYSLGRISEDQLTSMVGQKKIFQRRYVGGKSYFFLRPKKDGALTVK